MKLKAYLITMTITTSAARTHTILVNLLAACLLLASVHVMAQPGAAQYFTVVAPGVVKDSRTGLEWMRCSVGQEWSVTYKTCIGKVQEFNWQGALDMSKKLNATGGYGGKSDWRVPTLRELQSIRYCSKGFGSSTQDFQDGQPKMSRFCNDGNTEPTIDLATFPATPVTWYWSSTPTAGLYSYAWLVGFRIGYLGDGNGRDLSYAVRLVR
jgi:hypothetical protein